MNKVKYQIFVSSTYDDLKEERDQVIKACLEMGHIPVGMEMFSAADEEQWQIITRQIDESDYYVLIVANRYGSMVDGIGYTEKEYDYAISKGVPVLGFVLNSEASWPVNRGESTEEARVKLDSFKQKVKLKPVNFWTSKDDLHGRCAVALMKTFNTQPRPGWVRSTEVSGPEVTAELTRLSSQNATLMEELAELRKAADVSGFAQGDDQHKLILSVSHQPMFRAEITTTWNETFLDVVRALLHDPSESNIKDYFIFKYENIVLTLYKERYPEWHADARTLGVYFDHDCFYNIRAQLIALGLIQVGHVNQSQKMVPIWQLTTQGERQYGIMLAQRR